MKYFLDCEFFERQVINEKGRKDLIVDLISIGIVSEIGQTYYAVSNEFDVEDLSDWLKENVVPKLPPNPSHWRLNSQTEEGVYVEFEIPYKSREQIGKEIYEFVQEHGDKDPEFMMYYGATDWFFEAQSAGAYTCKTVSLDGCIGVSKRLKVISWCGHY